MTSSADLTAAGGAWVAIGIMDDKDMPDEDTKGASACNHAPSMSLVLTAAAIGPVPSTPLLSESVLAMPGRPASKLQPLHCR